MCFGSIHKDHKNRPVKFFWHQIQRDTDAVQNSIGSLAKIDSMKESIITLCHSVNDHHFRQLLNSSIIQFFMKIDDICRCKPVHQISKALNQNIRGNIPRIKGLFKSYCSLWQKNMEEDESNEPNFNKTLNILIKDMK